MDVKPARTVDEYIRTFPPDVQSLLQKLRRVIRETAPQAKEMISYRMPAYKQNGYLVFFAAFEHHIGLYPLPAALKEFKADLAPYKYGKGSIQFPLDKPIPYDLVKKIVRFRLAEDLKKRSRK